ncbi:MAG: GTPase [Planctomycetota bacterium]
MDNDTIIAISSPLGNSLRGIIRLSGKKAFRLVQDTINKSLTTKNWQTVHCTLNIKSAFLSEDLPDCAVSRRESRQFGTGQADKTSTKSSERKCHIPVTLYLMHAPRSYTSEDVVEIHTFGARVLLESIVEYFISKGARLAAPGEFTKRAFLNGRINLSQAEAVLDIIHSSSEREHRFAVSKLYEHSSIYLGEIRDQLVNLISRIEISLDFSDQDIEIISYHQIKNTIDSIFAHILKILRNNSVSQSVSADGIICVLCGKTNVGKSSIFNRLVADRKNIVSPIPGTTRDYIEGIFSYQNTVFRLFDTAGPPARICPNDHSVGRADGRSGGYGYTDEMSRKARKQTEEILKQADIYLMVIDGSRRLEMCDIAIYKGLDHNKTLVIINKIDKQSPKFTQLFPRKSGVISIPMSAYTGKGVPTLKKALWKLSDSKPPERSSNETIINMRQQENLRLCLESLDKAKAGVNKQLSYEFIVLDLRQALDLINSATGTDKSLITDNILNNIFSRFCIGK